MSGGSKRPNQWSGPDFSAIDSLTKAEELFRRGDLENLFLMPLEFGGEDNPRNTLYVPVGFAGIKAGIDNNIIRPLVSTGKVTRYEATPEYQGQKLHPDCHRGQGIRPRRVLLNHQHLG